MYYILKLILFPWKFVNNKAKKMESTKLLHGLLGVILCFATCFMLWTRFFPKIDNIWRLLFAITVFLICMVIVFGFGAIIASVVLEIILFITHPMAALYDACDKRLHAYKQKKANRALGNEAKAEVSLEYFINQDKNKQVYRAKYLGKN